MISNNELRRLAKSTLFLNLYKAARHPRIANLNGGKYLRYFATGQDPYLRAPAAGHPGIAHLNGGQHLRNLVHNKSIEVRRMAATHPRIANLNGGQLLRKLANRAQHTDVRQAAARHPGIATLNGGKHLRKLAKNNAPRVRREVVFNPGSANVRGENDRPLILALLEDEDANVRGYASVSEALKILKNRDQKKSALKLRSGKEIQKKNRSRRPKLIKNS